MASSAPGASDGSADGQPRSRPAAAAAAATTVGAVPAVEGQEQGLQMKAVLSVQVKHGAHTHMVVVRADARVSDVMEELARITNVHPRGQKLIHKGKVLSKDTTLAAAKVANNAKMMLMTMDGVSQGSSAATASAGQQVAATAASKKQQGLLQQKQELLKKRGAPAFIVGGSGKGSGSGGVGGGAVQQQLQSREKERQAAWVKTGIASLREERLQAVPSAVWAAGATLRVLDLGGNELQTLPPPVSALVGLQRLRLSFNELTEDSVSWPSLAAMPRLTALALDHNRLSGVPAGALGQLTGLRRLNLSHNAVHVLHADMGHLTLLEWLDASCNKLKDLPPALGDCTALAEVNLCSNFITSVPSIFASLTELKTLLLDHNTLRSFPSEVLRGCTQLQTLSLHGNAITIDQLRELDGWGEYDARRRAKYSKQLDQQAMGSSAGFDEGADKQPWQSW